jgi:hypothetical protein
MCVNDHVDVPPESIVCAYYTSHLLLFPIYHIPKCVENAACFSSAGWRMAPKNSINALQKCWLSHLKRQGLRLNEVDCPWQNKGGTNYFLFSKSILLTCEGCTLALEGTAEAGCSSKMRRAICLTITAWRSPGLAPRSSRTGSSQV